MLNLRRRERSRLQHQAVRGRLHVFDRKGDFVCARILIDRIGIIQSLKHGIIRFRRNGNGYRRRVAASGEIRNGVGEGIRAKEVRAGRVDDRIPFQPRRAVRAGLQVGDGHRLGRMDAQIDVGVIFKHRNGDRSVLRSGRGVVHGDRGVVYVQYRHGDGCRRGAAVAVGNRIGEAVAAHIICIWCVTNFTENDDCGSVLRIAAGLNAQRVGVNRVRVVCQNVDGNVGILVQRDAAVVGCARRVVDRTNGERERVAYLLALRVFHNDRNRCRPAVEVRARLNVQLGARFALCDHEARQQGCVVRRRGDAQRRKIALRIGHIERNAHGRVFVNCDVRDVAQYRRGAQGNGLQRGVARLVLYADRVIPADAYGKCPFGNNVTTRGKVVCALRTRGVEGVLESA